ncbi:uncharacterized protein LOC110929635 isoform X3 [Helianthus annuus]|uniref:uncharacterized protein LOC110929635 isoform X3 n=1 Tax=Helianthus annuus TaxID=4232 RepID=UPI000B8FC32F|nr:uncharacterized protein LOC110929635 isoform X3 [Helianthus annuus]
MISGIITSPHSVGPQSPTNGYRYNIPHRRHATPPEKLPQVDESLTELMIDLSKSCIPNDRITERDSWAETPAGGGDTTLILIICDLIIPCEENHKRYFDFQRRTGDLPVQKEGGTHTSRNLFKHWCSSRLQAHQSSYGFVDYFELRFAALAIVTLNGRHPANYFE